MNESSRTKSAVTRSPKKKASSHIMNESSITKINGNNEHATIVDDWWLTVPSVGLVRVGLVTQQ
jgi:hypothetical protein